MHFLQLDKLDARYKGHHHFSHRVWIGGTQEDRLDKFLEVREWCSQVWGLSCERDIFTEMMSFKDTPYNPYWAWYTEDNAAAGSCYIYLTSTEALAFFKLKWM